MNKKLVRVSTILNYEKELRDLIEYTKTDVNKIHTFIAYGDKHKEMDTQLNIVNKLNEEEIEDLIYILKGLLQNAHGLELYLNKLKDI